MPPDDVYSRNNFQVDLSRWHRNLRLAIGVKIVGLKRALPAIETVIRMNPRLSWSIKSA
jgi:hypothetical protein